MATPPRPEDSKTRRVGDHKDEEDVLEDEAALLISGPKTVKLPDPVTGQNASATGRMQDISERIVPEENVFLVAPRCPIEYVKGYKAALFPNSPRVTCFDHAAADKSIDLISDFLEAEGGVKFFEADDPAANTSLRAAYRNLNPRAYRSDLWRAAILYYCGGVYMDAKAGIPSTGLSREAVAEAGGVFANFLRPNLKSQTEETGSPTRRGRAVYLFAPGELAVCYDRWKNPHRPGRLRISPALMASYPRNPTLLYVLREQIELVAERRYSGYLMTGPDAITKALSVHECHRRTFASRCGFVSLQEDVFPTDGQGERLRAELNCESATSGSARCGPKNRYYAMLPGSLLSRYVQAAPSEQDLCSHARLLRDLSTGGSFVKPKIDKQGQDEGRSEEEVKAGAGSREGERQAKPLVEVLAEELEREGRFSARVLNATRGALLVGWTSEMHTAMQSGKGAESLGGPEKCSAHYGSLFGKHKIYCSDLDGGEHGADPCNVACRNNSKVAGSAAEGAL
eukprot:g6736.t1